MNNILRRSLFAFIAAFTKEPRFLFLSISFILFLFIAYFLPKMSCSKPINFVDLNFYIFEHLLKYLEFIDLVSFVRINSFWKETIEGLLRRRKTFDYHSCPGL